MATAQNLLTEYGAALNVRELELARQKTAVLAFVVTDHNSDETKQHILALRDAEVKLNETLEKLLEVKLISDFEAEAEKLCGRCKQLGAYTQEMNKLLTEDLSERYRIESKPKETHTLAKVTFFFALPAALATMAKNGVGDGAISPDGAAVAGFAVSGGILSRKKIISAFSQLGAAICAVPQKVKDSFLLYYVRESIRSKAKSAIQFSAQTSESIKMQVSFVTDAGINLVGTTAGLVRTGIKALGDVMPKRITKRDNSAGRGLNNKREP